MEAKRNNSGLDVLLEVWSRRKWLTVLLFTVPFAVAVTLALALPSLYRSTATLLLERLQVSETYVKHSVTSELETRLHTISQKILSRSRLQELITQFDLYPTFRELATPEEVVERMRRDIRMQFKGREIRMDPKAGEMQKLTEPEREHGQTIAFTLSFRGRDPETVAKVTNTLASLFVEENRKLRERQAAGTADFLRVQLEEMKKKLDREERRLSEYKGQHLGELPEQTPVNQTTLIRLNAELRLNKENQARISEWLQRDRLGRQLALAGQLAIGSSAPPIDHTLFPDGHAGDAEVITARLQLARLKQELTDLRARFSGKYPDVIRVQAEIAALERQLAAGVNGNDSAGKLDSPVNPSHPPNGKVRSESEKEFKTLKEEEKELRQAIAMYQQRVDQAPLREQEYQERFGDYKAIKDHYGAMLQRYQEAQVAESMEHGQKEGDQVRLMDPAIPATKPAAPSRVLLIFIGLILSTGLAGGVVKLIELRDTSFHTLNELRAFTKVPVLASIPHIVAKADTSRFRLRTAAALVGLAILVGITYYFAQGNEEVVSLLARNRP